MGEGNGTSKALTVAHPRHPQADAPKKLSVKHQHLAYLLLAGKTVKEAGAILGYRPNVISRIRSGPAFQAFFAQIQGQLHARLEDGIVQQIQAEAPRSLKRLTELRDQSDALGVSYQASAYLLDKHPAVAAVKATVEAGVRILLDADTMRRMEGAVREAERVLDVPSAPG